jgi:hypothetical protein
MQQSTIRNTLETLLAEIFEGPANPNQTWIVSSEPDSGLLGTLRSISAEQAKYVPEGLKHSIAEHVAHLHFSIDQTIAKLRGDHPSADWRSSWNAGDFDDCAWQHMQRSLRESQLRLRMDVHNRPDFEHFEQTCDSIASLAHVAYHLGCVRQIAAMLKASGDGSPLRETGMATA